MPSAWAWVEGGRSRRPALPSTGRVRARKEESSFEPRRASESGRGSKPERKSSSPLSSRRKPRSGLRHFDLRPSAHAPNFSTSACAVARAQGNRLQRGRLARADETLSPSRACSERSRRRRCAARAEVNLTRSIGARRTKPNVSGDSERAAEREEEEEGCAVCARAKRLALASARATSGQGQRGRAPAAQRRCGGRARASEEAVSLGGLFSSCPSSPSSRAQLDLACIDSCYSLRTRTPTPQARNRHACASSLSLVLIVPPRLRRRHWTQVADLPPAHLALPVLQSRAFLP